MKPINPKLPQKILFIEREDDNFSPVENVPDEYLHLIIPYAGVYYYSDPACDMISQNIRLKDFTIWVHEIFARKDLLLSPFTPVHIVALHYMDSSSITAYIENKTLFSMNQKELNLFNLHSHFHQAPMEGGKNIFSFHINIVPGRIGQLVSKFPGLEPLLHREISTTESGPLNEHPLKINPVSSGLIQSIFTCRYIEVPADYFLYRCCVDLLQNFLAQEQSNPYFISPKKIKLLHEVIEYIKTNLHLPLNPAGLAKTFGFFLSDLEESFYQLFAITVQEFILQQKMMKAYDMMAKTRLSLAEIAAAVGCRGSDELTWIFELYYGCIPNDIRSVQ